MSQQIYAFHTTRKKRDCPYFLKKKKLLFILKNTKYKVVLLFFKKTYWSADKKLLPLGNFNKKSI